MIDVFAAHGIGAPVPVRGDRRFIASGRIATAPTQTAMAPALIAVAHGSRDPRSATTMAAVVAEIAAARPDLDVHLAFLDLSAPSVEQVVDVVAAQGHTHAIVVPLLLGSAFHARVDLPGLLDECRARHPHLRLTQADVLGPDPRLIEALRDRVLDVLGATAVPVDLVATAIPDSRPQLADPNDGDSTAASRTTVAPADPGHHVALPARSARVAPAVPNPSDVGGARLGVAVAAVGSSSAAANARSADVARQLSALTGWPTEICFATTEPTVHEAISRLRARGADHVLLAPWFLAPGLLTDRLATAAPDLPHANVIGAHPAMTEIVWDRYDAAWADALPLSA
ncbi:Sirohydrochlorin ferrochelatase [Nocardia amikacinitolerans]|uniref:Sirohydrochlorin ferrochelatase n=2 Tax=Nocardia amikacinitolerans TaxID=756689 RepID=A0A285LDY2_9NOCA|nr:Sirohydrochlorin ferrochelatase [Nocardia amikacinitolerans]